MARSRSPFVVAVSGALSSACACRSESQFPTRTPVDFTLFTRVIPAANSGASSPLSAASTASLRIMGHNGSFLLPCGHYLGVARTSSKTGKIYTQKAGLAL